MFSNHTITPVGLKPKVIDTIVDGDMAETMGDRIARLLREGGRQDRDGWEYEQQELYAWLTGQTPAPDGKIYNFEIGDKSFVSRLVNDKIRSLDRYMAVLDAICDIFHVDMEWLARGNSIEKEPPTERFVTTEANEAARLIDSMDVDYRKHILDVCDFMAQQDLSRRNLQSELANAMRAYIEYLPPAERQRMRLLISQIENRRRHNG